MAPVLLRLLDGPCDAADTEQVAEILRGCATIDLQSGEPYFDNFFPDGALLVVEEGFIVVRMSAADHNRSIVTSEAGPGLVVPSPSPEEVLFSLSRSRLTALAGEPLEQLLAIPGVARVLLAQIALTLAQNREALGNFGTARHIDRVKRKLLQLGRRYGRVGRDGLRFDFPLSHTVLAAMIGSSRETVTRALDELQREGFVARRGHTYFLMISPERVAGGALDAC